MSPVSAKSYLSVAYDLRPSKQVERRMLLDFFRRLAGCGAVVESYRYTGMGSIHFMDHILFHKFLGIDKLVSVERDEDIERRVHFNRPFDNVELKIMEVGDFIPQLSKEEKHIVWLDYDYRLSEDMIEDVRACASHLSVGSFVLVTVDAKPPKNSTGADDNFSFYKNIASQFWKLEWTQGDFSNELLHLRVLDLMGSVFLEGVAGRRGVDVLPCISFVYADGHQMVTLGVQIGTHEEAAHLERVKNEGAVYLVTGFGEEPFYIDVPVLTRRERLVLEAAMPSNDLKKGLTVGVSKEEFEKFSKVYRFLPSYAELLLG